MLEGAWPWLWWQGKLVTGGDSSLETLSHETTRGLMGEAAGHTQSNEQAIAADIWAMLGMHSDRLLLVFALLFFLETIKLF